MRPPQTRFEIDLGAIASNVRTIRATQGPGVWVCVALKADAYGFGLVPVARAVTGAGANALGAGSVADGIQLRAAGIDHPILVYGGDLLTPSTVQDIESHDLIATVHDAASLRAALRGARRRLKVMIEIDVGLERLGFDPATASQAALAVRSSSKLDLRGIYTHMRVAEGRDARSLRAQFTRFKAALVAAGPVPLTMAASSRVLDRSPDMALNAVDVGRAVYGLLPPRGGLLGPRLRPALGRVRSCLITVRVLTREERKPDLAAVGRLGVIPFGRAAGMAELSVGAVLVGGRRARLVGAPSLQHMRVDLSRHPLARVGDEVVIVGRQGRRAIGPAEVLREHPSLPDAAIALQVRDSVPRVYVNRPRG
jgi:alanine racemase